jgi:HEAT repeat protein
MRASVAGLLPAIALLAACAGQAAAPARAPDDPEGFLFGGERCKAAADCATGTCSLGICLGFLTTSTDLGRDRAGAALARGARDAALADGLDREAGEVLGARDADRFVRSRAADAYRFLPPALGLARLPAFLDDPEDPVAFFVARALHALGDARGTERLRTFLDHPSEAVRALAREALGGA